MSRSITETPFSMGSRDGGTPWTKLACETLGMGHLCLAWKLIAGQNKAVMTTEARLPIAMPRGPAGPAGRHRINEPAPRRLGWELSLG